jgi:hypothetical protein
MKGQVPFAAGAGVALQNARSSIKGGVIYEDPNKLIRDAIELQILLNRMSQGEKITFAKTKLHFFYKPNYRQVQDIMISERSDLNRMGYLEKLDKELKAEKIPPALEWYEVGKKKLKKAV